MTHEIAQIYGGLSCKIVRLSELSEQAKQRLAMPTEQAIEAGVAAKPRRKEAVLE